ncbi:hypothetical protein GCM10017714_02760 [Curtobacterium pusillum]|nr:hypothetical protein GCM10017610_15160 [Curtobacterium pusillum]
MHRFAGVLLTITSSVMIALLPTAILVAAYLAWVHLPLELAEPAQTSPAYLHYGLVSVAIVVIPALATAGLRRWTPRRVARGALIVGWSLSAFALLVVVVPGFFPEQPPWHSWSAFRSHVFAWSLHLEYATGLVMMAIAGSERGVRQRSLRCAAVTTVPVCLLALMVMTDPSMPWMQ